MDDNELTLDAFSAPLRQNPGIDVIDCLSHAQALTWDHRWTEIDMVIIDAADETLEDDQFPGVQVVKRVRTCQLDARPDVVIVTGHFFNDGLRHRMAEIGADYFFLRSDLRTSTALIDIVLHPDHYRRGVPPVADVATARSLGITSRSRVSELVSYVTHHGLGPSLDPNRGVRGDPHSRRWYHHRQAMAETSRIEPVNLTTGEAPHGDQRIPSWRQFSHVLTWATKVTTPINNWLPTKKPPPPDDCDPV